MKPFKETFLAILKMIIGGVIALVVLAFWYDQQQSLEAARSKLPKHWTVVSASFDPSPTAWAINGDDGEMKYCTLIGDRPNCSYQY